MTRYIFFFALLTIGASFVIEAFNIPHKFEKGEEVVLIPDRGVTMVVVGYSSSLEGDTLYELAPVSGEGENFFLSEGLFKRSEPLPRFEAPSSPVDEQGLFPQPGAQPPSSEHVYAASRGQEHGDL